MLAPVLPWGAACHYLGLLAGTLGRTELARPHFEQALALNSRIGSRHWLARAELAYATLLLEEGSDADCERAIALLADAEEIGQALGMDVFVRSVRAVFERLPARMVATAPAAPTGDPQPEIRAPRVRAIPPQDPCPGQANFAAKENTGRFSIGGHGRWSRTPRG